MMKTITEYQPMIYSVLFAGPERRRTRHRQNLRLVAACLLFGYFAAILKIMADTGLAVWDWQFWIIFGPLLALGERLLWTLSRRHPHLEPVRVPPND